jgi:(R,R)-butanediol dehydrogenase / meso-butanediol dehydrogenase / diacetyl reductase
MPDDPPDDLSDEMRTPAMRSATYRGDAAFTVQDADPVPPAEGEVRIDVAYTGICGTDLHIYHGAMDHRVTLPAVIGHEMSGRIAELGPGVTDWSAGDPVTVMPLRWCGQCPACLAGHQHICHRLDFVGIDSPGSMQSSWTVPASLLVRLPPDLPLRDAALIEPTAVAVHDVRRARLAAGEKVVVVGGGPVGLLIGSVARAAGAQVRVLELDAARRAVAEQIGLVAWDPTAIDAAAAVREWTGEAGADVAFEVSGSAAGVQAVTGLVAVRGRVVVVAIHSVPREVDLFQVFWRELTLIGARVYEREDFERAVELLATGQVLADALISQVVGLDDVASAFAALEHGGAIKVLVDCAAASKESTDV